MLGRKTVPRQFLAHQTSDFRFLTSVFRFGCWKGAYGSVTLVGDGKRAGVRECCGWIVRKHMVSERSDTLFKLESLLKALRE
jgi:hypothetical protein